MRQLTSKCLLENVATLGKCSNKLDTPIIIGLNSWLLAATSYSVARHNNLFGANLTFDLASIKPQTITFLPQNWAQMLTILKLLERPVAMVVLETHNTVTEICLKRTRVSDQLVSTYQTTRLPSSLCSKKRHPTICKPVQLAIKKWKYHCDLLHLERSRRP